MSNIFNISCFFYLLLFILGPQIFYPMYIYATFLSKDTIVYICIYIYTSAKCLLIVYVSVIECLVHLMDAILDKYGRGWSVRSSMDPQCGRIIWKEYRRHGKGGQVSNRGRNKGILVLSSMLDKFSFELQFTILEFCW